MSEKKRRAIFVLVLGLIITFGVGYDAARNPEPAKPAVESAATVAEAESSPAMQALEQLEVKGKAPKTDYARKQFSDGWAKLEGCDMRNFILKRDMTGVITRSETDCTVMQGNLLDPYTNKTVTFVRSPEGSDDVQIDHVISLSNAWQTGAQQITAQERYNLSNDPLNLLAVEGAANQQKSDADASGWLPPNKDYRCRFIARQIAVKKKYRLWVTSAERDAMKKVLGSCPGQLLPYIQA